MKAFKKTLTGLLALVTACGMLSTAAMAEEAAPAEAPAQAEAAPVEAEVKTEPIQGSWVLYEVYEVKEGAEPVLLKKEENQSLYGSGIGVYTFDSEGAAHHNMIDGADNVDAEALWAVSEPNVYAYTEGTMNQTFRYVEAEDTLHSTLQEESRTLDFVYARAMVGSWKLDKVTEIHEGDASVDLPKEENQSLYGAGESILTFKTDGKTSEEITDGADKSVVEGTWKLNAPDSFTYTEDTLEMEFNYFRIDDTLLRDVKDDAPDAAHPHLRFTYVRVIPQPEVKQEETKAAQAETKPAAAPAPAPAAGQKRTGFSMDLVAEEGGDAITIFELEDFTYVDDNGITYTQEGGGGEHWYGSDGRVWVFPDAYDQEGNADGQNFTGFEMNLYNEATGDMIVVKELTQGGYVDEATGITYTEEGGGGDHWYGSDGSVMVSEWGYNNANAQTADDAAVVPQRTGFSLNLVLEEGGDATTIYELEDHTYVDSDGMVFTEEGGGGEHWYGSDGSVWIVAGALSGDYLDDDANDTVDDTNDVYDDTSDTYDDTSDTVDTNDTYDDTTDDYVDDGE